MYVGTPWVAAPGAAHALVGLVDAGYRLAVVSNSAHGEMEELLVAAELCSTSGVFVPVATVADSQVVGIRKPDPRIFHMAVRALSTKPSLCIHVGDSVVDDVMGARAAGLTPVHIDPLGWCRSEDHAHASSLLDFATELIPA
ncbi:MAG: HAD family hydrolase [Actinobacteria bacterium]|nr:MAG: HAD family hydrolase [Actinomycetota bacterium]